NLTSLRGLDNLVKTSRNILILSNPSLTSLDALYQLRSVMLFDIEGNTSLAGIGFASLQLVSTRLIINNNSSLAVFSAPALTSIGYITQFNADGQLTNIDFPALITSGPLLFTGDPELVTVTAPVLASTTGDIQLNTLPLLETLDFSHTTLIG